MASRHSLEDIERALLVLAVNGGQVKPTVRQLAGQGHKCSANSLRRWRDETHRDTYLRLSVEQGEEIRQRIATEQEEFARASIVEEHKLLLEIAKAREAGEIPGRDLAGALRNVSTSKGIALDKAANLRGRPSSIIEHRSPDELLRKLERLAPGLIIDSTAEEIEPKKPRAPGQQY